jgi:hypothetical protein
MSRLRAYAVGSAMPTPSSAKSPTSLITMRSISGLPARAAVGVRRRLLWGEERVKTLLLACCYQEVPACRGPPVGTATQLKERVGRTTLFSSSAMSSGRLFLDRVARRQSPSSLHRRDQNKLLAQSEGTIYHRAVSRVLTGYLSFRDRRTLDMITAILAWHLVSEARLLRNCL